MYNDRGWSACLGGQEQEFGWIAEVGIQSPLPPRWTAHSDNGSGGGQGWGVDGALNHVVNWSPPKRNKGWNKKPAFMKGKPMVFIGPDDEAVFLVGGIPKDLGGG